jgi:aminopeptidase N
MITGPGVREAPVQVFVRAAVAAALVLAAMASPAMAAPPAPAPAAAAPPAAATPAAAPPAGAPPRGTVGASGVGDPFFPLGGNGGIDVQDYALALNYDRNANKLSGTATLRIVATQDLSRFDLDLRDPFVLGPVTVDGAPATAVRDGEQELLITPRRLLRKGSTFTVVVPYSGVPEPVIDPDESSEGWVRTNDGAVVVNEPQGSPGWYPANDTPRDKATYTIAMTVPNGLTAVGNGALVSQKPAPAGRTTFTWRERFPMAPHLVTITIGTFTVRTGKTASGIPIYTAVDPTQAADANPVLRRLPEMVTFLENLYGRYPFETVGAIVDNAPELGYALETQTKPVFDTAPDELTLLHELSHQWYGDAVTLRQWPDIWLHEGFATWSEWIWTERTGGQTAADRLRELAATDAGDSGFWNPPPGKPGDPASLFDGTIYDRGAMTLQALREQIGDRAFFTAMRRWYAEHRYGNVSTPEFIALAQQVSGQDLREFFRLWLFTPGKPSIAPSGPASSAAASGAALAAPKPVRR